MQPAKLALCCLFQTILCYPKNDDENKVLKKDYFDSGGSEKYFVKKSYPVECKDHINATKKKKSLDHQVNIFYSVIQEICNHNCTTPLSQLRGSRSVQYTIPNISHSIHYITKDEPSMNPCQIFKSL